MTGSWKSVVTAASLLLLVGAGCAGSGSGDATVNGGAEIQVNTPPAGGGSNYQY